MEMFEVALENMTAVVFVETGLHSEATASNIGVPFAVLFSGGHRYTYAEALATISALDDALRSCPKYIYKRLRALRLQFTYAFGPEMATVVGVPSASRT